MSNKNTWLHGGDRFDLASKAGMLPQDIIDFSANMNPLGPPEWLRDEIDRRVSELIHYPDPHHRELTAAACLRYDLSPQRMVWGNGASQLLYSLASILPGDRALIPVPCYSDYARAFEQSGFQVNSPQLKALEDFAPSDCLLEEASRYHVVVLGNPNNPTGTMLCASKLRQAMAQAPETLFLIDEAFMDFSDDAESLLPDPPKNAIVLRSLTKFFAIPGLRLGFVVAEENLARKLRESMPAWSVNTLAQAVGKRGLEDIEYQKGTVEATKRLRLELRQALAQLNGLTVYPSHANYLLCHLGSNWPDAPEAARRLLGRGIAIRTFENQPGLGDRWIRVAVGDGLKNRRLLDELKSILKLPSSAACPKPTPALFMGGTGSNVGKTLITAAFCRILVQEGFRVAPFKAQNMSLQAYVTRDGLEMSRAQALQARAARLDPEVNMNPVLMKPMAGMGSQIILNGRPHGLLTYQDYKARRNQIREAIYDSYNQLASQYDVIILEGAGSLAEVNLKSHDLVNLSMARHAQAPALLIGDIDRGGVFASFVGTMSVLNERERELIKGFLINRFRGDERLLDPALAYMLQRTGRPVLGTIPHISGLNLPEEDSVNFKNGLLDDNSPLNDRLDVLVLDLPHISNFSDLDPLLLEEDVRVRTTFDPRHFGKPHVVIIPGTRNTVFDLDQLKSRGLDKAIWDHVGRGGELIGICGG